MTSRLDELADGEEKTGRAAMWRPRLLSVAEAAAYLGVSDRWMYDQVRGGRLAALFIARAWRIRPEVLEQFADSFKARPAQSDVG